MAHLNIDTVELVSTLRTAPQNGAPSSRDYNDSQRENLQDLASLAETFNNAVIPLLNTLAALDSQGIANVLNGDTVFASSDTSNPLFVDAVDDSPLTVSDVLNQLYAILQSQQTSLTTLTARVSALTTQLSSTNQDDIAKAIQGYASQLAQFYVLLGALQTQGITNAASIANLQTELNSYLASGGSGGGTGGGTGGSTGGSGGGNANITLPLLVVTANHALSTTYVDSQTLFSNFGAAGTVNLTLPSLPNNLSTVYRAVVETAQSLAFVAGAGTTISFGGLSSSSGGSIASSSLGSTLTLKSGASGWFVEDSTGTWTVQ